MRICVRIAAEPINVALRLCRAGPRCTVTEITRLTPVTEGIQHNFVSVITCCARPNRAKRCANSVRWLTREVLIEGVDRGEGGRDGASRP